MHAQYYKLLCYELHIFLRIAHFVLKLHILCGAAHKKIGVGLANISH